MTDPGLIVCVKDDDPRGWLPMGEYAPLLRELATLQDDVNLLLEKMAQIACIAQSVSIARGQPQPDPT